MKPARVPQTVVAPDRWGDLPWGELYRKALERQLNPWFTKMYGFHLLKIGNLSAEINCEASAVSHQGDGCGCQGLPVLWGEEQKADLPPLVVLGSGGAGDRRGGIRHGQ